MDKREQELIAQLRRKAELEQELKGINSRIKQLINNNFSGRGPGRPSDDANEWAWRQIEAGRSRDDILPEFLERKGWEDSPHSRDALRKLIARRKPRL